MKTTQNASLSSPKHTYMANITFAKYVEGIGQAVTVTGNSIQDVKNLVFEYKRFNPHVVIRENKAEYPKFDWVVIEEYNH
jgi:hypothetical protein